jgi:hypothetical protein
MKMESNWKQKSLENLEKKNMGVPDDENPRLVNEVLKLRKKPLNQFTVEDCRIMLGQQEGLSFLVPIAIEILNDDLFAEGDFYPGDLLKAVLTIDSSFWAENRHLWAMVNDLIEDKDDEMEEHDISPDFFYNSMN